MREEEKIFAGKLFNNQCEELKAIKRRMHEVNRLANALPEWDPEREELLRGAFGAIGKTFHFVGPAYINYAHVHWRKFLCEFQFHGDGRCAGLYW